MDIQDRKIVGLLAQDARRSLAEIGGEVGLSPSAVNERIKRLTASGTIRRFTVEADAGQLGFPVLAFVFIELAPTAEEPAFRRFVARHPSVCECHHVTGGWSYLVKLRLPAIGDLESFLSLLKERRFLLRSETAIAMSTVSEHAFVGAVVA